MHIRVKLMGALRSKLPPNAQGGVARLELQPGATIQTALEQLAIAGGHVHLIMVNGAQESDHARHLEDGDEVVVFPPVAGG
jgi:molybdopterin converting factor small subunit